MMTNQEAKKIVGNNSGIFLKNMHKALSMHRWLNTEEQEKRLQATCVLLNKKYENFIK